MESLTASQVKKLKVGDLKEQLKVRGLDTSGLKPALLQRLLDTIDESLKNDVTTINISGQDESVIGSLIPTIGPLTEEAVTVENPRICGNDSIITVDDHIKNLEPKHSFSASKHLDVPETGPDKGSVKDPNKNTRSVQPVREATKEDNSILGLGMIKTRQL